MADDDLMDLDEVIEEESPSEDVLGTCLVVITTAMLLGSIIIVLLKLANDYQAGLLA